MKTVIVRAVSRSTVFILGAVSLFLLIVPLTLPKPGLPVNLKADESAYYLMALSLVHDGDLLVEEKDVERVFLEFPYAPVRNLVVMSDDGWRTVYFSKPLLYPLLNPSELAARRGSEAGRRGGPRYGCRSRARRRRHVRRPLCAQPLPFPP